MITLREAQELMDRMLQLEYGPKGRIQRQEVLDRLCQSRTIEIGRKAVTIWMDNLNTKFPKPGEIYSIITSLNVAHVEAEESEARRLDWEAAQHESGPRKEVWEMTAEELEKIPDYLSGLPTNPARRGAALKAWRIGGAKGLQDWRAGREPQEAYHGEF